MNVALFIRIILLLGIIYIGTLFVIWTTYCLYNEKIKVIGFVLPIIIIAVVWIPMTITKFISDKIYSTIYLVMCLYLGYLLMTTEVAAIIRIIDAIWDIPTLVGVLILYILPLLICIYGIINALITKIVKKTLVFSGYKDKVKICLISDLHLGAIHQKGSVDRIVKEIQELDPDIVVNAGDMLDGSLKVTPDWLEAFNNLTVPILFVAGNHEDYNTRETLSELMKDINYKYIGNHERFFYKGVNFLGEDYGNNLKINLKDVEQTEGVPNVLLTHEPLLKPKELKDYNVFLCLCGHTHGGQIFPLQLFEKLQYGCFSGLYSDNECNTHVFVTDGLNNALAPMRIGSHRVLALITIQGDNLQP